jgi:hypothetical protein
MKDDLNECRHPSLWISRLDIVKMTILAVVCIVNRISINPIFFAENDLLIQYSQRNFRGSE